MNGNNLFSEHSFPYKLWLIDCINSLKNITLNSTSANQLLYQAFFKLLLSFFFWISPHIDYFVDHIKCVARKPIKINFCASLIIKFYKSVITHHFLVQVLAAVSWFSVHLSHLVTSYDFFLATSYDLTRGNCHEDGAVSISFLPIVIGNLASNFNIYRLHFNLLS